jgi:hypothetical protein
MRNALFGLIFGTIVAQPFLDNGISWTVFGLCGAAAGTLARVRSEPDNPAGAAATRTGRPHFVGHPHSSLVA